jgi:hypothetical protein
MKTSKIFSFFLFIFFVFGVSTAHSSGYPALSLLSSSDPTFSYEAIVVAKYEQGSFTSADAENLSQQFNGIVQSLVSQIGGDSSNSGIFHFTPSQLATYGYTDADALKDYIKNNYVAAKIPLYIFLDVSRTPAVSPALGNNIRADVWIDNGDFLKYMLGDMGIFNQLGDIGDYFYFGSLEFPEKFLSLQITLPQ